MIESMFHLHLPILEKLLRPMVVYLFLIGFLRLFGKRELAQLNPFDLVVLLSLSNTVQNAMIGDDNSVTGGIIGAFGLLAINWLLTLILFKAPKLDDIVEGADSDCRFCLRWRTSGGSMKEKGMGSPETAERLMTPANTLRHGGAYDEGRNVYLSLDYTGQRPGRGSALCAYTSDTRQ